ncbi:hypothetical protein Tco_0753973 [Tanacetum coccineum]
MDGFEAMKHHLRDLYLNSSPHAVDAFKPAFHSFFGEEHQTFRLKMFRNLDQLRLQLEKENLLEVNPRTCLDALRTQFKEFFASKRFECSKAEVGIELENHNALSKSVNETQLQQHESLVTESTTLEANLNSDVKALDAGSVITESSETKSDMHDTSNSSRTYITHVVDANIRPVNDQVPSAVENEMLNKEWHLKRLTKELYDSNQNATKFQRKIIMNSLMLQVKLRFHDKMTFCSVSLGLALQCQMTFLSVCLRTLQARSSKKESVLPGLKLTPGYISSGLVQNLVSSTPYVPPSKKDYEILFQPLFDEYFNPPPRVVSLDPVAVAAQELLIQSVQLRQLPLIKMYHLLVLHQQIRKFNLKSFFKVLKK